MLDDKQIAVLKVLNKLVTTGTFKVVTNDEISALLSQKIAIESEQIKPIVEFLGKENYINLKFAEDNTYCYAITSKTTLYFAQLASIPQKKKSKSPILIFFISMLASFIGTMLAMMIFFYFTL